MMCDNTVHVQLYGFKLLVLSSAVFIIVLLFHFYCVCADLPKIKLRFSEILYDIRHVKSITLVKLHIFHFSISNMPTAP